MSQPPPTIISLKQSFLQSQTRLLSQPLTPTRGWRSQNSQSDAPLPEKAIDDALYKLNHLLTQHSRRVHAPQATRHVAEQLDALYLNLNSSAYSDDTQTQLTISTDLADAEVISSLPPSWPESSSSSSSSSSPHDNPEQEKYGTLVQTLQSLSSQREILQKRLARLRGLQSLLDPFSSSQSNDEPEEEEAVQQNLVTRNGELEKELEKMRVLLARVGGRVGMLLSADRMDVDEIEERDDDDDNDNGDDWERRKVEGVLDSF
ncbi:putative kinetochore protein [Cladorrhinum sp. PSN259]|nr:putative kinetochore protein [Cladorrhinum sp. PSN259]